MDPVAVAKREAFEAEVFSRPQPRVKYHGKVWINCDTGEMVLTVGEGKDLTPDLIAAMFVGEEIRKEGGETYETFNVCPICNTFFGSERLCDCPEPFWPQES